MVDLQASGVPASPGVAKAGLNIRWKLLLSLLGTILLLASSGVVSTISFDSISAASDRVTRTSLPSIESAQRLLDHSARLASFGPRLRAAASEEARADLAKGVAAEVSAFSQTIARAAGSGGGGGEQLQQLLQDMASGLKTLDEAVAGRLKTAAQRKAMLDQLETIHDQIAARLAPLADVANNEMLSESDSLAEGTAKALGAIAAENGRQAAALRGVDALVVAMLAEADKALTTPPSEGGLTIDVAAAAVDQALRSVDSAIKDLPAEDRAVLDPAIAAFRDVVARLPQISIEAAMGDVAGAEALQRSLAADGATRRLAEGIDALRRELPERLARQLTELSLDSKSRIGGFIGDSVSNLRSIMDLQAKVELLYGMLSAGAATDDPAVLARIMDQIDGKLIAVATVGQMVASSANAMTLTDELDALGLVTNGPDNVLTLRQKELGFVTRAADAVVRVREVEARLSAVVNERVEAAKADALSAGSAIGDAIAVGEGRLVGLVIVGVLLALALFWFIVERGIVRRLYALTKSMTE
ncbi:MAG: hypothetical protein ACOVVK_07235, partial [Elsteraceae bacterium]